MQMCKAFLSHPATMSVAVQKRQVFIMQTINQNIRLL